MKENDSTEFARLATSEITGAIRAEGKRQAEVAGLLSLSQSYVSERFGGAKFFDLDEIETIGAWLGYPAGEFLIAIAERAEQRLAREQDATVTELHPRPVVDLRAAAYDDEPEPGDVDEE